MRTHRRRDVLRTPAPAVRAISGPGLAGALARHCLRPGITNKSLRALMPDVLHAPTAPPDDTGIPLKPWRCGCGDLVQRVLA